MLQRIFMHEFAFPYNERSDIAGKLQEEDNELPFTLPTKSFALFTSRFRLCSNNQLYNTQSIFRI